MFLLLIDVFFLFVSVLNQLHPISIYIVYLRTKFQDGIDKPQKCQNVCYHPMHQQQSDFLILVLYDFIVQNILSSLVLLCYNLMNKLSQRFITIFNCCYHTSNHLSVCHKHTSLSPINCQSGDNCIIINTLINHHDPIYL
jgi:hypothetical protein